MEFKKKPKKIVAKKVNRQVSKDKKLILSEPNLSASQKATLYAKNLNNILGGAEKAAKKHIKNNVFDRFNRLWHVRKLIFVWLVLMAALLVSVGAFSSLSASKYLTTNFTDGGMYSEGSVGEVKSLNPIFAQSTPEKIFSKLAFSRLFSVDTTGNLNKELVAELRQDDLYRKFTITINNNGEWSDGQKITADDVIFTVDLLKNKSVNPSKYQGWKNIELSKKDDYNIEIKTPTDSSLVLYNLDFPILPKHAFDGANIEKLRENKFSKKPITSGVFTFDNIQNSSDKTTISMIKNNRYFKGASRLSRFEITAYPDNDSLKSALVKGEILAAPNIFKDDLPKDNSLVERQISVNRGILAFMNNSEGLFKNINLRKVVQEYLDTDKIRSDMRAVEPLNYPILPQYLDTSKIKLSKIDKSKAGQDQKNLGWIKKNDSWYKDNNQLEITIATTTDPNLKNASEEIKRQLENIGFKVKMIIADKDDKTGGFIQSVIQPRSYDILVYEINFGADTDYYGLWHSSQASSEGLNFSNYKDAVSDDILLNLRKNQSFEDKRDKFTFFTNRWLKNAVAIPIAQGKFVYTYKNSVLPFGDIKMTEDLDRFSDVRYWRSKKSNVYKTI